MYLVHIKKCGSPGFDARSFCPIHEDVPLQQKRSDNIKTRAATVRLAVALQVMAETWDGLTIRLGRANVLLFDEMVIVCTVPTIL
jgi:hypothetical protein